MTLSNPVGAETMTELAERDFFTDHAILRDPYEYFEAVRAHGPVYRHAATDVVYVTGFDETLEVLKNTEDFSSALAPQGPATPLPFEPAGSDISEQIEAHRDGFVGGDLLVALDDRRHALSRALLMKLFTPSRLKANEAFIVDYADRIVRDAVARGSCDLVGEIATPFVTMVIADLLAVPEQDRQLFMEAIAAGVGAGSLNPEDLEEQNAPLMLMGLYFSKYVAERRACPADDVISELANTTYSDGTLPDEEEVVRLTTFLFGAGQDTSAKLLGNMMRFIVDEPGLQARLRADPSLILPLIEEVLRLEGSSKMTARLARRDTSIGGMPIPAGTRVMLALAAANRDPRRWDDPAAVRLDRPRAKEHLAFGRGAHVCAGAPLARVEVKLLIEKFLEHTAHIDMDARRHGPSDARTLEYEPSFIIRGLSELWLTLTPKTEEARASAAPRAGLFGRFSRLAIRDRAIDAGVSTATTKLSIILADPRMRAVMDRHFPGVASDPRIGMAKGLTLRFIQKFAPEMFTDDALDAMDRDLQAL